MTQYLSKKDKIKIIIPFIINDDNAGKFYYFMYHNFIEISHLFQIK